MLASTHKGHFNPGCHPMPLQQVFAIQDIGQHQEPWLPADLRLDCPPNAKQRAVLADTCISGHMQSGLRAIG